MYYILYKITNKLNQKYYIGAHQTLNLDDGYFGSGKILKRAIKKYGIECFEKEILEFFDNKELMFEKEKAIVCNSFVNDDKTYNLKVGGCGGWEHVNSNEELRIEKNKKAMSVARTNGLAEKSKIAMKKCFKDKDWISKRTKKQQKTMIRRYGNLITYDSTGHKHTTEAKEKISKSAKQHQRGKGNSQYGTVWVSDLKLKKSYKINRENIEEELRNSNVIIKRIVDFNKYFDKIHKQADKENKKRDTYISFLKIKEENKFNSNRELYEFLIYQNMYNKSQEALRRFMNKMHYKHK